MIAVVKRNIRPKSSGIRVLCTIPNEGSSQWPDEKKQLSETLFASSHIRALLSRMTGLDLEKVFKAKEAPLRTPMYKFMTDNELKRAQNVAMNKARRRLAMPPFLRRLERAPEVISEDPELQGLISNNLICVDISPGFKAGTRCIVVRQPDGVLREATMTERTRANQAYFPQAGREVKVPLMFRPENLKVVLDREDYLFVLDRACAQFEPEDPEFVRITEATYLHVNKTKKFDALRSTRHFGPMTFFLTIEKKIENLLVEMIQRILVDDAIDLIELYCLVHDPTKWGTYKNTEDPVQRLKMFSKEDFEKSGQLDLVIQSLSEHLKQQRVDLATS